MTEGKPLPLGKGGHTPSRFEDGTIGMAEALMAEDLAGGDRNGVADRTAAEVLRRNGFDDARLELWFGYVPEPLTAD